MTLPAATPAPGQLIMFCKTLDGLRLRRTHVATLPPRDREALTTALDAVQWYMDRDCHVGPMLEGALRRIREAVEAGPLEAIQKHDLKTVTTFLLAVPPTVRAAS